MMSRKRESCFGRRKKKYRTFLVKQEGKRKEKRKALVQVFISAETGTEKKNQDERVVREGGQSRVR